ncbi:hypothetical protein JW826_01365 [Candidatus Woesearchaeota archaeon]|nr:hypothetical protein [Candidatus Woesearchaeota archaeon]
MLAAALAAFLLSISLTLAADTKIYDAWHYSGDTFTLDGQVFLVTHMKLDDDRIILRADDQSFVIMNGTCEMTSEKRYCLNRIFRDIDNAEAGDPIKFEAGRFVYAGLQIQIYKRGDVLTMKRTLTPGTPIKDEEVSVTVTIENPTDFSTDSFRYEDTYPEGVRITSGGGYLDKTLHGVVFDENIPPRTTKTLVYGFTVDSYIAFKNYASMYYTLEGKQRGANTSTLSVDLAATRPYLLSASISPGTVETGGEATLSLTVQNKKWDLLEVESLEVDVPPQYVSFNYDPGTFTRKGSTYSWSGAIDGGVSKSLSAKLRPSKSGTYSFPVRLKVKDSSVKSYTENRNLSFTASYKAPELILSVREKVVSEGGPFRVAFSVKNSNKYTGFKNVNAILNSNITIEESGMISEILPGQTKTLLVKEDLVAPSVDAQTDYLFRASGHYYTTFGEEGDFEKSDKITVKPVNKSISLTQTLDKTTGLRVGDNVTVTVKVAHATDEIITVDVGDAYSPGLLLKGGKASDSISFDKSGTKQAYIYSLVIPENFTTPELYVKTEATIRGKPGLVWKMTVLPVNLTKLVADSPDSASTGSGDSSEPAAPLKPTVTPKEEGVLTKIVNGVTGFFKRLFGVD